VRNKSLIVYKGLRNDGVDALIALLKRTPRTPEYVIGISLARTNSKEVNATPEAGIADYVESFRKLNEANVGDYYTINISCPNSFGGETFTNNELFKRLMAEIVKIPCSKPIYIKMPINAPWEDFAALLDTADRFGVQGVIIGNLNKNYKDLDYPEDAPAEFRGGLSGKPCFVLSNELIRKTRAAYGKRFTIIGVGGILTPEDAMAKFEAGSDLVQMISGMIFGDPGLMKEICEKYAETYRKEK
jgi:dihydroorotate dehydrogenase